MLNGDWTDALPWLALLGAGVQWAVASRRDTGVVSLALVALAALHMPLAPWSLGVLMVALVLMALAWLRGGSHGVGRPGLVGIGVLTAVAAIGARALLPGVMSGAMAARLLSALTPLPVLVALIGLPVALERPGPLRAKPRVRRRVPVE